jgi:hypothetical protein
MQSPSLIKILLNVASNSAVPAVAWDGRLAGNRQWSSRYAGCSGETLLSLGRAKPGFRSAAPLALGKFSFESFDCPIQTQVRQCAHCGRLIMGGLIRLRGMSFCSDRCALARTV